MKLCNIPVACKAITLKRMAQTRTTGLALGVLSAVSFGASGPCAKALTDAGFTPLQAVWVRVLGTALFLAPVALVLRRRVIVSTLRANPWSVFAYALTAVSLCQALYFVAASRLPVSIAILLEFTGPVLVVGWLGLVRRRHVPRTAYIGVATAVIGLLAVVQIWSGLRLDPIGVAAAFGAACGSASYFLIIERLIGRVDPLVLTSSGMCVGAVLLLPLAAPWNAPWHLIAGDVRVGVHEVPGWDIIAVLVIVSTVIGYLAGASAIQRLSAPIACGVAYIEAVSASVFAWIALGQQLGAAQICGGVIVLLGAYIAQRSVAGPDVASGIGPEPEPIALPAAAGDAVPTTSPRAAPNPR
jgi:drug/metabolite transporter (DMT)-like permease